MAEGFSDLTELNHVNPTLAALNLRHEALMATETAGELNLSDAGSLSGRDEESNEFLMSLGEDR